MSGKRGICINFGNCDTADRRQTFDVLPGGDFKCPQCLHELRPAASRPRRWWLGAVIGALLLAAVVGYVLSRGSGSMGRDPLPVPGNEQGAAPQQSPPPQRQLPPSDCPQERRDLKLC